jgi:hypothetical protein
LVHAEEPFRPETINWEQMVAELVVDDLLERWYSMHIFTKEQVRAWLEQALVILTSDLDDSSCR